MNISYMEKLVAYVESNPHLVIVEARKRERLILAPVWWLRGITKEKLQALKKKYSLSAPIGVHQDSFIMRIFFDLKDQLKTYSTLRENSLVTLSFDDIHRLVTWYHP